MVGFLWQWWTERRWSEGWRTRFLSLWLSRITMLDDFLEPVDHHSLMLGTWWRTRFFSLWLSYHDDTWCLIIFWGPNFLSSCLIIFWGPVSYHDAWCLMSDQVLIIMKITILDGEPCSYHAYHSIMLDAWYVLNGRPGSYHAYLIMMMLGALEFFGTRFLSLVDAWWRTLFLWIIGA